MGHLSKLAVTAGLLAVLMALAVPAHANLVTDPGFESCSQGTSPPPGWSGTATCSGDPHTGNWSAAFINGSTLSQSIVTIPGDVYDLSFYLAGDGPSSIGESVSFGSLSTNIPSSVSSFPYTLETFDNLTVTGTSTTLSFTYTSGEEVWWVDDVSLTDVTAATPETSSLVLLAAGLLLLMGFACLLKPAPTAGTSAFLAESA